MKNLLVLVLVVVLVGGALKVAGVRLPLIDYPVGPFGLFDGRGPAMPDIQIEPPGFGDFPAP
jgi:hypothetical protein